ncbi:MAG: 4Fe-4S binding protein [Clostridium sp.]|uniref:4Fe-4S binding protein n=1 Tax=Clostridium sp. TaxID=1506 RepID=UPI00290EB4CF|nr:4Fe-4S binding protein [Clostridium sp.]MDU4938338.1 4Fe-4S binding protein [Clostridium sp.]
MKLNIIYFSPTGGTKKVLDIISEEWNCDKREIDLSLAENDFSKYSFERDDICIVGVPSFGGRAPQVALSRIREMCGGSANTIIVAVYGNRAYEDTLLELEDTLEKCNFHCIAAIAANAEHSIMHEFGKGRPDNEDEKDLRGFVKKIKEVLKEKCEEKVVQVPGNSPYKEFNVVPFIPMVSKECNKCGLCIKKCPTNAIYKDNPLSLDESKCISCMRCISICLKNARMLDKERLSLLIQKLEKVCSTRKSNELFII